MNYGINVVNSVHYLWPIDMHESLGSPLIFL